MAEGKRGNRNLRWYIQCLNWCWNHRLAVTGIVASIIAMWFWRFWLLNYGKDNWIIDCWYLNFIEGSQWLNILIFSYAFYIAIIWGYYACKFKRRWYHLFIYGITIATIWAVPAFTPVTTPIAAIQYHELATILIGIVALIEMGLIIFNVFKKRDESPNLSESGFVAQVELNRHQETGWSAFTETLLGMVDSAQLQHESFTIGISGSWGSGKTTFYEIIKRELLDKGRFGICEFQPWQVVNYSQLGSQFFATFKHYLLKRGVLPESDLISDISKYAGVLESLPQVSSYARPIISAIQAQEDTNLQTQRDHIGDILAQNNYLTAVMIDDLDRLNKNELMEVLRLIRVSANFRNVLFVVTYDKDHIANVMGENGKEYLKKIVNVEINLPPIENYKYRDLLLDNIQRIVPELDQTQISELKRSFRAINKTTNNTLLNKYSHNFRDLVRFSNHFGLVIKHLYNLNVLSKYNLHDMFWLEILHYFDESIYYKLQEHPLSILEIVESGHTKQAYLALNDSSKKDDKLRSKAILEELFDVNRKNYGNTIIWVNNYNNYFAHRLLDNAVSFTDFSAVIEKERHSQNLRNQIKEWYKGHARISLVNVVKNYPHNNAFTSELAVKNYVRVLFELSRLNAFDIEKMKELFRAKSRSSFYSGLDKDQLKKILRRLICQHPSLEWNHLLSSMCVEWTQDMEEWDDYSRFENEFVLRQHRLIELAQLNYAKTFNGQVMPLSELFNSDSKHFQFISSLSYIHKVYIDEHNNKIRQYSNLIGNYIVDEFELHYTYKAGTKEFKYIYDNLIQYSGVKGMEDDSVAISLIQETIEQNLGSLINFEKIVNRHFKLNSIFTKRCKDLGIKIKA